VVSIRLPGLPVRENDVDTVRAAEETISCGEASGVHRATNPRGVMGGCAGGLLLPRGVGQDQLAGRTS
jgi:hypothetical protein